MKNGTEFLLTDTVGFIQKLPTMLVHIHKAYSSCLHIQLCIYHLLIIPFQVAAFRATLEEISESSVIVHLVDIRYGTYTRGSLRCGINFMHLYAVMDCPNIVLCVPAIL
jgi:50S ribosomal subunit-associated GTPase HflX